MLKPRLLAALFAVLSAAVAIAGCGGENRDNSLATATPYREQGRSTGLTSRVGPAAYRRPTAQYRRHVRKTLGTMLVSVAAVRAAAANGDVAGAKKAWLAADRQYESIGAAYGAFGDLDAAINGTPGGLPGGVRSEQWTGLHRIEYALWSQHDAASAASASAKLAANVSKLRRTVGAMEIDPLEYSLRAHEVLEDSLHLQLSGVASPWSGSALNALDGNERGTRVVLASLAPMLRQRSPQVYQQADLALNKLHRELGKLSHDGRMPAWDTLSQIDRERVNGLTAGAAEQLAFVPGAIDPRPPMPAKRAIGATQ